MLARLLSTHPVHRDLGLLIVRLGVGLSMLVFHGWDKLTGGPAMWEKVGGGMANFGITFFPTGWGFLAACAESIASALLVLGLFFRPACLMLAFTMFVAVVHHVSLPADAPGAGLSVGSHALELLCVYVGLFLVGPGRLAFRFAPGSRRDPAA